jgi:archaellum component FlaF (FlaF/FlaG flagellin family)
VDSGIPALVVSAIFLLGASFLARSSIASYDRLGQQIKSMEVRSGEQTRTRLTITSATLDAPRAVLTVQLRNDGQTSVGAWATVDVLISYYSAPTTKVDVWVPYTTDALAANTWKVASISPDTFEPGILNPGETATLQIQLSPVVAASTTNLIVIAAENGVTVSALFTS